MGLVVELGAGTGVFTRYISEQKSDDCQFLIVEQDADMRERLRMKFPEFHYGAQAERTDSLLVRFGLPPADCIVSGLPFANFSDGLRSEIIGAVSRSLQKGGLFIAFQYSLQLRDTLRSHFTAVDIEFVPLNLPPAFIYRCRKGIDS